MSFKLIAWFIGMWVAGSFVYSIFGTQIGIINKCAKKMYTMIYNDTEYWYSEACKKYLNKVVWRNITIILVISALIVCFVPLIGVVGFFVGLLLAWLLSLKATSINDQNLEETITLFLRFSKPGMEEEFAEGLSWVARKLKTDTIFRNI